MRIAFLSQLLPLPLDAGPKVRAYYVLRHLAEAGHDVTLVCFVRDTDREADVQALRRHCRSVEIVPMRRSRVRDVRDGLLSTVSGPPFLIRRDHVPAMSERVAATLGHGSWDAVHADQLWMAPYASAHGRGLLRVLDQHNAVFRIPAQLSSNQRNPALRWFLRREAARLERFERDILEQFDRVAWVTGQDRAALGRSPGGDGRDVVIPIATDPEAQPPLRRDRPFRVTFLGGIHWPPNAEAVRWFAEHVWPRVSPSAPGRVFTVIGKGDPGRLAAAPGVEIAGYVPDLSALLAETAVFVVPLLAGAGMRVKILDAWCRALPVVSTSIGAEGIGAVHGENMLVADDPAAFADAVTRLLRDTREADRIGANGRATVEASYDWRKVYQAWERIYH